MFIVTGGAGLIGSAMIWQLNQSGLSDILVVDHLGNTSDKWKNLAPLRFDDYLERDDFYARLASGAFNGARRIISCRKQLPSECKYGGVLCKKQYPHGLCVKLCDIR